MLNPIRSVGGPKRVVAVAFVLVVVASGASLGAAAGAASAATVQVDAAADSVAVSETTTVHVLVRNVDGGVGAYDLAVDLSDPSVATITGVELAGDPGLRTVDVAQNGSRADLKAALLDTADTGDVTVATVTLSGVAPGTTDVSVSVSALGAEDGSRYPVEARSASVTVAEATPTPAPTPARTADSAVEESVGGPTTADRGPTGTAVGDDAEDAGASTPDAAPGASDSVANRTPVPFDADDVPAWAVGAAAVALAIALFAARRLR